MVIRFECLRSNAGNPWGPLKLEIGISMVGACGKPEFEDVGIQSQNPKPQGLRASITVWGLGFRV